jgi:hypothetical protein
VRFAKRIIARHASRRERAASVRADGAVISLAAALGLAVAARRHETQ